MFLTNHSLGKAEYGPLSQSFVNAAGILCLVSNNALKKEKRNAQGHGPFFFIGGKKCLLYFKAQGLGGTIPVLLPPFPLPNNQALAENCTTGCIKNLLTYAENTANSGLFADTLAR